MSTSGPDAAASSNRAPAAAMEELLRVMAKLRDPETGCPWDVEQTFATIAPYTIEEAYEVADAIERGDMAGLREELGDLLLQTVFHARMAEEENLFDFNDVARDLVGKLIRRHPHVFGDETMRVEADAVVDIWEKQKALEKKAVVSNESILDDVAPGLPAFLKALKYQKRAARIGFDWPDLVSVVDKMKEELDELREAAQSEDPAHIEVELGDLLFVATNLARKAGVDPETALRKANLKFERRFKFVEQRLSEAETPMAAEHFDAMEAAWQAAKQAERT